MLLIVILPVSVVIWSIVVGISTALDVSAAEQDRFMLEEVLMPCARREIALGTRPAGLAPTSGPRVGAPMTDISHHSMHGYAYINRQITPLIVACDSDPLSILVALREICADRIFPWPTSAEPDESVRR